MKIRKAILMLTVSMLAILVTVPIFAQTQAPPPPAAIAGSATFVRARPTRPVGCAHCALSGPSAGADSCGCNLSRSDSRCSTLGGPASLPHRKRSGRRDPIGPAFLGSQRSGAASLPVRSGNDVFRHELDDGPRKRISGIAAGRDGCGSERTQKGQGLRLSAKQWPNPVVGAGPYITIMPVDPGYIVVPYYDPGIVFFAPRPGFVVGGGIRFGFGVTIGGFFRPWGWGFGRFDWGAHTVFINNAPWRRTWVNRGVYVHPSYNNFHRFTPAERVPERHEVYGRSEAERSAAREGRAPVEEHHGGHGR